MSQDSDLPDHGAVAMLLPQAAHAPCCKTERAVARLGGP